MDFSSQKFADIVVAAPAGRIDHASATKLTESLAPLIGQGPAGNAGLIIDLSGVEYISSVGLRALLVAAKSLDARGGAIAVAALQPLVAEIFAISRFDKVIDVRPSVRAALQACSAEALAAFDLAARDATR